MQVKKSTRIGRLEAKGVLLCAKHKLRKLKHFGMRHLSLGDNLGIELCVERGRSFNYALLLMCRRLACLCMVTDSSFAHRWIPSEWNFADTASRCWEPWHAPKAPASEEAQRLRCHSGSISSSHQHPMQLAPIATPQGAIRGKEPQEEFSL